MSFAHMHDDPETLPRPDARERINDARVSEVAFVVRQIAKTLDDDDVIMMAQIIVRTLDAQQPLSRGDLERELRAAGRSPAKAAQLSSAIFK